MGVKGWFKKASHWASKEAHKAENWVEKNAKKAENWAEKAGTKIGHEVSKDAKYVEKKLAPVVKDAYDTAKQTIQAPGKLANAGAQVATNFANTGSMGVLFLLGLIGFVAVKGIENADKVGYAARQFRP